MSEVAVLRFMCDGCGKHYPWKPELSHKKAKCKCGTTIVVPDLSPPTDDEPPPLPDDRIFDYIDNAPEVASPRAEALRVKTSAPVAARAAAKSRAAPVLGYRQGPTARDRKRANEQFDTIHDMKRDVYVPTALTAGSFVAYFAWLMIHGSAASGSSLAVYGGIMLCVFALKTVFMLGGAFVVASLASVSFGPFWTAILKLAAVSIAPDIFATILQEAIGVPGAWILASALSLAMYWGLISWLFSMDASEAWMVVALFGVLRYILTTIISLVVLGMIFSGTGGPAAMGFSAGGNAPAVSASAEAVELNEKVANWKDNDLLVEGLEYIDKTGRQSGMMDTINALYDGGAKHVWFAVSRDINGKKEPLSLIAEWPGGEKKRAAMLAAIKKTQDAKKKAWAAQHPDYGPLDLEPITDEGGKYVQLPIGG